MRISRFQQWMQQQSIDLFLIEDPLSIEYLTGFQLSLGKLLLGHNHQKLFVDGRYFEKASLLDGIEVCLWHPQNPYPFLSEITAATRLGFDSDRLSYAAFLHLQTAVMEQKVPLVLEPVANPLKEMRAVKDQEELDALEEAAELGSRGYDFVLGLLKEGISEQQVATELEIFWRRQGASGVAFESIIAFGANSSHPHHRASQRQLRPQDVVLIDIGVTLNRYHSDMTRTHFFKSVPEKMQQVYELVLAAHEAACSAATVGMRACDLDAVARTIIEAGGWGKEFCHSLGHGIGLQVHEFPRLSASENCLLKEGMVITIEPGIYLPRVGGVRIEDTVVIEKATARSLTQRSKALVVLS